MQAGCFRECPACLFLWAFLFLLKMGVVIRPPKAPVTAENKDYLQMLDALDLLEKAPVDEEHPYEIIAEHIQRKGLQYKILLAIADRYYNHNTVLCLAHTASMGGNAL